MHVNQAFAAKDVYYAALLGGVVGYFGLVLLVATSVIVGGEHWAQALNVFVTGLLFTSLPALIVCALVVAPVGLFIAIKALGWLPETRWHGAMTGVLTASAILIGLIVGVGGEWREAPDMGTIAFVAAALMIAAATGWLTQTRFLPLTVRD